MASLQPTSSTGTGDKLAQLADNVFQLNMDEETEAYLLMDACREFCIGDAHKEERFAGNVVTPADWIEFREDIQTMKGLTYGSEKIIIGENGLLIKQSNMKPVCSFPSCFSTDGTESNQDNRCNQHVGLTKYGTIELEFDLSDVEVARYNAFVMFVHKPEDDEMDIRRKLVQAFKKSGHLDAVDYGLRKEKHVGLANQLRLQDAALPIRRYKYFNELDDAIYYVQVLDMSLVFLRMGLLWSSEEGKEVVIPRGPYKGKNVNLLPVGGIRMSQNEKLLEDVEIEQKETFGFSCHLSTREFTDEELEERRNRKASGHYPDGKFVC